jgi:hypothetical protein
MATLTVDDSDIEGLVRSSMVKVLRDEGKLPTVALCTAAVLLWLNPIAGAVAFGMGVAWGHSLVKSLRSVRPWYRSHHGSLAGPITVELTEDGVRTVMPLGEGMIWWKQLSAIRNQSSCFVLEFDGDPLLVMPKRHFSTEELALLQAKALEIRVQVG